MRWRDIESLTFPRDVDNANINLTAVVSVIIEDTALLLISVQLLKTQITVFGISIETVATRLPIIFLLYVLLRWFTY